MFEVEYSVLAIILVLGGFCCFGLCCSCCQRKGTNRHHKERKKMSATELKKIQRKELVFIVDEVHREITDLSDNFSKLKDSEEIQQWLATQLQKLQGTDTMAVEEHIYDAVTDLPDDFSNIQYSESKHITQETFNENIYDTPRFKLTPTELRAMY